MKTAKSSMKSHKSPSMGKGPPLKKSGHSRSPYRVIGSSRPSKHLPSMKPLQKRPPSPPVRMRHMSVSPPRRLVPQRGSNQGSPVSMDRLRSVKRPKFEKQKPPHLMPSSSRADFGRISPYPEKYSRSSAAHPSPPFPSSVKKMRREEEGCYRSPSPPTMPPRHRRAEDPHQHAPYQLHPRSRSSSSVTTKEVPAKRYREESPGDRYVSPVEKSYAPTLHERFSSCVDTSRSEPRLRYSTQDLEKITIDIHRNIREDRSPTLRRILNPSEVKLVRRADEGHRPIFDREEIKQAPRDLREDAHYERRMTSYGPSRDLREVENYEITRHRFEPHRSTLASGSGRSLSDRWQDPEGRKEASGMDREDRDMEYGRGPPSRNFGPRSETGGLSDPDYRSDRYSADSAPRQRPNYQTARHRLQERDVIPVLRKDSIGSREMRHRKEGPPLDDGKPHYPPEKRYGPKVERHPSRPDSPKWHPQSREHPSEYARRNDKYSYRPSWEEKQEVPHRSPSYYKQEGRDGMESYRGRSSSRTFRSPRGFRSRGGYRPPMRGGDSRYRGSGRSFRGGSSGIRGRSSSRRGRFSPGLWEHDLYSRTPERKMGP